MIRLELIQVYPSLDLERFDKTQYKIGMLTPRLTIKLIMNLNFVTQPLQSSQITLNVFFQFIKKKSSD